jgi:hypothetical protein
MMLEACLGITIDALRHEVRIEEPTLPEGIDWLEIGDLRLGAEAVTITFRRVAGKVVPSADRTGVKVVAVLSG